jgi:hypothetical protein
MKLYKLLFELGPSAQGIYGSLNDPRPSRLDDAEDNGILNISDKLDMEDYHNDDTSDISEEDNIAVKIIP